MNKLTLPDGSVYEYKPVSLYLGKKKINIDVAKKNLEDFSEILKENNISFFLYFGTLLGAIRENGFIAHDEDVDIALLIKDFSKFQSLLFLLRNNGFELARIDKRGFASVIRNNEYIDLYFFYEYKKPYLSCCGEFADEVFFQKSRLYKLYEKEYPIPYDYENVLQFYYGENWMTPVEYKQSYSSQVFAIIRQKIKNILPCCIADKILKRKEDKKYKEFLIKYQDKKN